MRPCKRFGKFPRVLLGVRPSPSEPVTPALYPDNGELTVSGFPRDLVALWIVARASLPALPARLS